MFLKYVFLPGRSVKLYLYSSVHSSTQPRYNQNELFKIRIAPTKWLDPTNCTEPHTLREGLRHVEIQKCSSIFYSLKLYQFQQDNSKNEQCYIYYIVILFWFRLDTIFGNKKRFLNLIFFTIYARHFSHDHRNCS